MKLDPMHWSKGWLAPLFVSALGCGSVDPSPGGGTARDDAASRGAVPPESGGLEATRQSVLFEDPPADGPRLTIVDLGEGRMGVMVSAPIGTPLPSAPDGSLVDLYKAIHPEVTDLPATLVRAASTETDIRRRWQDLRRQSPELEAPRAALIEKSLTSFNNAVCHTFVEGTNSYTPRVCRFANAWIATTYDGSAPDADSLQCFDRSYAWNASGTPANVLWLQVYTPYWATFTWTLPAFTWSWFAVYCGANVRFSAEIANTGPNPELGITWHDYFGIIP